MAPVRNLCGKGRVDGCKVIGAEEGLGIRWEHGEGAVGVGSKHGGVRGVL